MDKRTSDHKSDPQSSENQDRPKGKTPSTAPNTSMETGAGEGATGFDSPAVTSSYLPNTEVGGPELGEPYFPPGGAPQLERSGQEQGGSHPRVPANRDHSDDKRDDSHPKDVPVQMLKRDKQGGSRS